MGLTKFVIFSVVWCDTTKLISVFPQSFKCFASLGRLSLLWFWTGQSTSRKTYQLSGESKRQIHEKMGRIHHKDHSKKGKLINYLAECFWMHSEFFFQVAKVRQYTFKCTTFVWYCKWYRITLSSFLKIIVLDSAMKSREKLHLVYIAHPRLPSGT